MSSGLMGFETHEFMSLEGFDDTKASKASQGRKPQSLEGPKLGKTNTIEQHDSRRQNIEFSRRPKRFTGLENLKALKPRSPRRLQGPVSS